MSQRPAAHLNELKELFSYLKFVEHGRIILNITLARGLAYYTGTVFEGFLKNNKVTSSICGGGRYDNLLADVGGQPLPGVGFAMGDVVIGIILQEAGLLPEFQSTPAQALVTVPMWV